MIKIRLQSKETKQMCNRENRQNHIWLFEQMTKLTLKVKTKITNIRIRK